MSDWNEAVPGDVVIGRDGHEWTVISGGLGGEVTISRPGRKPHTGVPFGPVQFVKRAAKRETPHLEGVIAKGLIATKLGGVEVGKQEKDRRKPWLTPAEFLEPGSLLAHMGIFHNVRSDTPDLAGLIREHDLLHGAMHRVSDLYEPHVHDPDYEKR